MKRYVITLEMFVYAEMMQVQKLLQKAKQKKNVNIMIIDVQ